jgi:cell division protein ZipA
MIAAIWWWSTRRSGQAPGNAELRESTVVPLQGLTAGAESRERDYRDAPEFHERKIAPLEPLSIRTGDFENVPIFDLPMMADAEAAPPGIPDSVEPPMPPAEIEAPEPDVAPPDPPPATVTEQQKIITVRVCAVGDGRWSGEALISALEAQGLAYGRYQVYHRKHADGRSIFFVASLIEPGTFDAARMAEEEHRGVSMFAVLPGPLEPLHAVDSLFATARELARELSGTVQDANGMPFSPQRVAALREDVARFQSALNS